MTSYHERLDNLFAAYAPDKRGLVAELLQKYSGMEEEIMQSLVKRFGPEPTASPSKSCLTPPTDTLGTSSESYRERLVRFYSKYAPKKLSLVDKTLARFVGREEELFFAMVKIYGPEPPGPGGPSGAMTGASSDTCSIMSTTRTSSSSSSSSSFWGPYDVHSARWRLARIFMEYAPVKLVLLDQMMDKYTGREDEMLSNCVERYGPEPPPPDTQSPRARLERFIEHYIPHKKSSVGILLEKYAERTEMLFGALVRKLGPEPPAPHPFTGTQRLTHRQRLVRFYKVYAQEKIANVETVLQRYKGAEEEMFRILVEKYGPEPDDDIDLDAPIPPEKDYNARLTRLFTRYAPDRLDTIPLLLTKYKGREDMIIKKLADKLGPEDPLNTPLCNSSGANKFAQTAEQCAVVTTTTAQEDLGVVTEGVGREEHESRCPGSGVDDRMLECSSAPLSRYRRYAASHLGEDRLSALESIFGVIPIPVEEEGTLVETSNASSVQVTRQVGREATEADENVSANFACLLLVLETVEFPLPEVCLEEDIFREYPFRTLLGDRDRFTLKTCVALMGMKATFNSATYELCCAEGTARECILQRMHAGNEQLCAMWEGKESYTWRLLEKAIELLPEFETKERQEIFALERIELKGKVLWFSQGLHTKRRAMENDSLAARYERRLQRWKSLSTSNHSLRFPVRRTTPYAACDSIRPSRPSIGQEWVEEDKKCLTLPSEPLDDKLLVSSADMGQVLFTAATRAGEVGETLHPCRTAPSSSILFSEASPPPRKPRFVGESPRCELRFSESVADVGYHRQVESVVARNTGRDKWGPARDGRLSQVQFSPCFDAYEAVLLDELPPVLDEHHHQQQQLTGEPRRSFRLDPFFFEKEHRFPSSLV